MQAQPTQFQPTPFASAPVAVKPAFVEEDDAAKAMLSPGRVFISIGTFMLSMLCLIPIWNGAALLQNPIFEHMVGDSLPVALICASVGIVVAYFVIITMFFQVSRREYQTEQTILLIGSLFLTALGVTLLLLSAPLAHYSQVAYSELWNDCQFGPKTQALTQTSQALQAIRAGPQCAKLHSIEECPGFQQTRLTDRLKAMEFQFKCSGFCYTPIPGVTTNVSTAPATKTAGAVSKAAKAKPQLLAVDAEAAESLLQLADIADLDVSKMKDSMISYITFTPYPPTLFSTANFQAACDSMAARNIKNFAGDVAQQTFYEGVVLVLTAVVLGILKLASYFGPLHFDERSRLKQLRDPSGYGAAPQHVQ